MVLLQLAEVQLLECDWLKPQDVMCDWYFPQYSSFVSSCSPLLHITLSSLLHPLPFLSLALVFPFPPDRPGSWGLQGFCVSARRKMRRKKRDKEGSWKGGGGGEMKRKRRKDGGSMFAEGEKGGIKERGGGTSGTLVPLSPLKFFLTFIFSRHFHYLFWTQKALGTACLYAHTLGLSQPRGGEPHYGRQVCSQTRFSGYREEIQHQTHPLLWESHTHPFSLPRWIWIPILHIKFYLHWRGLNVVSLFIAYQCRTIMMGGWSIVQSDRLFVTESMDSTCDGIFYFILFFKMALIIVVMEY